MATIKVAKALGELNDEVVFVGGAMVSLYIDDKAAEDIRPTKDIDLTFEVTTVGKLEVLREELTKKGFIEANDEDVICRFKYEDLLVDVMSTQEVGWAPSNRWFAVGFEKAIQVNIETSKIKILPLPYFLASKMEAFFDRGMRDLYASHDFEDIVYILNYTSDVVCQVLESKKKVVGYLQGCMRRILKSEKIMSALPGQLYYEGVDERIDIIVEKMNQIIRGAKSES